MKIIENLEQGTPEWFIARMMKVTGTKAKAVMGTAEAQRNLIAELISEEATELAKSTKTTETMERGTNEEPFAIKAFEENTGKKVVRIGQCVSEEYDWVALSPDGLIANAEGKYTEAVEVKCPDSKKLVLYKIENMIPMDETGLIGKKGDPLAGAPFLGIPSEYKWQCVHYFLVNKDLETLYFLVYEARFISTEAKLYTVELKRSNEVLQEALAEYVTELIAFRRKWLAWKEIVLPTNF